MNTVQHVEPVAVGPAVVVQVVPTPEKIEEDSAEEQQQGPRWGFWILLVVMFIGYCVMWTGLCFQSGNKQQPGIVLQLVGLGVAVGAASLMCCVIRAEDKSSCLKATVVFLVVGGIVLIPYLVILYTTEHSKQHRELGEDEQWLESWSDAAEVVVMVVGTFVGIGVLGATVGVGACLMCRASAQEPQDTTPTATEAAIEPKMLPGTEPVTV